MSRMIVCCLLSLLLSPSMADERVKTETYQTNAVYNIIGQIGIATLIQLEADEVVSTPAALIGMGDAAAWKSLDVRENNVILKPSAVQPDTNMVIVTNKRTYLFRVCLAKKGQTPTWLIRFRYPDTEAANQAKEEAAQRDAERLARMRIDAANMAALAAQEAQAKRAAAVAAIRINDQYFWIGSAPELVPTAAHDDGRFTRLTYNHGGSIPVFYKVMPNGAEALINSHIDPDKITVVLHDVVPVLRARFGDSVIEIRNRGYGLPAANLSGTSIPGVDRVERK